MKLQKSFVVVLTLLVAIPAFAQKGPGQGARPTGPQGPERGRQEPQRGREPQQQPQRQQPQQQPQRQQPQQQPQRQPQPQPDRNRGGQQGPNRGNQNPGRGGGPASGHNDYERRRLDRRDRERFRRPPSRSTYETRRNYGPGGPKGSYLPGPGPRYRYRPYAGFRVRPYGTRVYYSRSLEAQILSEILDGIYRDQYVEVGSTFLGSNNDYDVIPSDDCVTSVRLHVKREDANIDHALVTYWSPLTGQYESRTLEVNEYYEAGTFSSWKDLGLIGINERVCVTEVTVIGETLSPRATQAEVVIYGRLN